MRRLIPIFLLVLTSAALPGSAGEPDKGVDLKLISEVAQITASQPFRVGLHLHHHPDFHTYWKSPGMVGYPTKIEWKLPEGFTAGSIEWPHPERVDMAGHPAHGYTRDVLLTTQITPPEKLTDAEITIQAQISWMACAEACHPGNRPLSLILPCGAEMVPNPEHADHFETTKKAQPRPLEGWTAKVLTPVDSAVIWLNLTQNSEKAPELEDPYFFSEDGQISSVAPEITRTEDGAVMLLLRFPRFEHSPKGLTTLPGILAYGPADNRQYAKLSPPIPEK